MTTRAISLTIDNPGGLRRDSEPVRFGVPLPRGEVRDPTELRLLGKDDTPWPTQHAVLDRWSDGSIRWLLVETLVTFEAGAFSTEACLTPGAPIPAPAVALETAESGASTGKLSWSVGSEVAIARDIRVDERRALDSIELAFVDGAGGTCRVKPSSSRWESTGPLRATRVVDGWFEDAAGLHVADFRCRVSAWAGTGWLACEVTLHNPRAAVHTGGLWDLGDPASVLFRELALETTLVDAPAEGARVSWRLSENETPRACESGDLEIHQDSSGGENWASRNHVDRDGASSVAFRGAQARCDGREESADRPRPILHLAAGSTRVTVGVPRFWEEFPKSLAVRDGRCLRIGLFPERSGRLHELQGGERKTHTVWLRLEDESSPLAVPGVAIAPLHARLAPEHHAAVESFPDLVPASVDPHARYLEQVEGCLDGPTALLAKREVIDEYGWRHFGDLWADHETRYYEGPKPVISHYNNQYDGLLGFLLHFARTGDPRWLELARDLARHVVDIDLYHTRADRAAYNGGLFWHTDHYTDAGRSTHRAYSQDSPQARSGKPYGGGPSCEHSYSSGLLHWHLMTGDPDAREAVIGLADWVLAIDDGSHNVLGAIDDGPTGLASATYSPDYHGPGRGAGNCVNDLLDAHRLTRDARYLAKAEEIIRRVIHPSDEPEALGLRDAESRWSYLVFLHVLTKYLEHKSELGSEDESFEYARAALTRYVDWMAENERPYIERLDTVEFPTETWPAHDLRKSLVFDRASRFVGEERRRLWTERAEFYYDQALDGVLSFDTKDFTRPQVLLLTCGAARARYRVSPPAGRYGDPPPRDFGEPSAFVPQKTRVKRALKSPGGLLRIAGTCLRPSFWRRLASGRLR